MNVPASICNTDAAEIVRLAGVVANVAIVIIVSPGYRRCYSWLL
jgi:hypothetical protein